MENVTLCLNILDAPIFQLYLAVQIEVKTMLTRWCWRTEPQSSLPSGGRARPVTAT